MTTQKTLSELAADVQCESKYGAKLAWEKQSEWQKESHGYRVTLRYKGRSYSFDYWQGKGITRDPDASGCLECLLSDASAGDLEFYDFFQELGYDYDSRSAYRTWKQCGVVGDRLEKLLGDDFDAFMYAERS